MIDYRIFVRSAVMECGWCAVRNRGITSNRCTIGRSQTKADFSVLPADSLTGCVVMVN
jgi:hypothetical protein